MLLCRAVNLCRIRSLRAQAKTFLLLGEHNLFRYRYSRCFFGRVFLLRRLVSIAEYLLAFGTPYLPSAGSLN